MNRFCITGLGLVASTLTAASAHAAAYVWATDHGGNWGNTGATGWNDAAYPNSLADTATLAAGLTADRIVVVDVADAAMSSLTFNDTFTPVNNWTINADANNYGLLLGLDNGSPSIFSTAGLNTINADITLSSTGSASATLNLRPAAGSVLTIAGNIGEEATRSISVRDGGTVVLTGTNTFSGGVNFTLTGSVLKVSTISDSGGSAVGTGTANFTFNASNGSPALEYIGSANATTARGITMATGAPGARIRNTGAGTLTISGNMVNIANTTQSRSFRLGGTNTGANTYSGIIENGSGAQVSTTQVFKEDGGLWVLAPTAGPNTYAGTTNIQGGILRANDGMGIPVGSNVHINGGVWETGADITRALGSGAGEVRLTNSAHTNGFSAHGAPVIVALGGIESPAGLSWGGSTFTMATLVLNDVTANNTLDVRNALNLGNNAQRSIDVRANVAILSGVVSQAAGGINKGGAGTLILTNDNTYGGSTNIVGVSTQVSEGTLLVNGTHTNAGSYGVAAGATLGGNSTNITLAANRSITFNNDGAELSRLAPGSNGVGRLTVNTTAAAGTGGINLAGAEYLWEIGHLTDAGAAGTDGAGTNFDQLSLTGGAGSTTSLTLGGSTTLTVVFSGVVNPNSGDPFWESDHTWKVIDVDGTAITTDKLAISNAVGWANNRGFVSFVGDGLTGDAGDVYVTFTTVPEPAAMSLIAIAGIGLLARRRRNTSRSTR